MRDFYVLHTARLRVKQQLVGSYSLKCTLPSLRGSEHHRYRWRPNKERPKLAPLTPSTAGSMNTPCLAREATYCAYVRVSTALWYLVTAKLPSNSSVTPPCAPKNRQSGSQTDISVINSRWDTSRARTL